MNRLRLFAVVAGAASIAALASAGPGRAAPARAPHHPAPHTAAPAPSRGAVQWVPSTHGNASGLVHYPGGAIARLAQRDPAAPGKFTAAVRAAERSTAEPSPAALTSPAVPLADQATIKGRVTDSQHDPLAGVEVEAFTGSSAEPIAATTTNPAGHYALALPAGNYVGTFDEFGLGAGDSTIHNVRLQPGAQVRVRVTDRAGHPLAGVGTYPEPVMPYVHSLTGGGLFFVEFTSSALTGSDGTFTFRGLPSDASLICFSTSDRRPTGGEHDALGYADRCSRRPIAPAPGSSSNFPTVQLSPAPGGTLSGVVTTANGDPIANVGVTADSPADGEFALTDSDGSYRITGLPPGSYRVCADTSEATGAPLLGHAPACHAGQVAVRPGAVSRADITLHRGGAITGVITGPTGAPLQGATVFATGSAHRNGHAFTDAEGRYRIIGLPSGQYRVCVDTSQATDPDNPTGDRVGCYQHKTPVTVHTGSTHGQIDVRLRLGGAIAGRVTDATGAGVADAEVDAASLPNFGGGGSAVTDSNGDYRITGLSPGSYEVCVSTFELAGGASEKCDHDGIDVQVGQTTDLDESLAPPPGRGSIAVTVRDEQGRKVQGADVAVLNPCHGRDQFLCASEPLFGHHGKAKVVASQVVDPGGRVQIDGRKPGNFAVCVFAYYGVTSAGAPPTGYTDRCAGHTFNVAVTASGTTRVHITLHPGGRVTGRITDSAGHPVSQAHVHVAHAAPTDYIDLFADFPLDLPGLLSPAQDAQTHAGGTFSIRGVRPGARKVCVFFPQASVYLGGCAKAPANVSANATTDLPDLPVRRSAAIAGVVKDAAGHPLPVAVVAVFTTGRRANFVDVEPVHGNGHYRTGALPAGRYFVCFVARHRVAECYRNVPWHIKHHPAPPAGAVKVRVRAGITTTGINAHLPRRK
jgi:protocatechuate 3,4-dioxygenase beta subunit